MEISFDENLGEIFAYYTASKFVEGAHSYVHGGVLATLFDEAQGHVCSYLGHVAMTEKLQVHYHKAVTVLEDVQIHAWLSATKHRRLYTKAELKNKNNALLATSQASWYMLPERIWRRLCKNEEEVAQFRLLQEQNRKKAKMIRRRRRKERAQQ